MSEAFPSQPHKIIDSVPDVIDGSGMREGNSSELATRGANEGGFELPFHVPPDEAIEAERQQLNLCRTPEEADRVSRIMRMGKDEEQDLGDKLVTRNGSDALTFRAKMAELSVNAPTTYSELRNHRIVGFHGTRSLTLAGILEQGGLLSARRINELTDGPLMIGGEQIYQGSEGQSSISFSQMGYEKQAANSAGATIERHRKTDEVIEELRTDIAGAKNFHERGQEVMAGVIKRSEAAIKELTENPHSLRSALMRHDFPVFVGISGDFIEGQLNETGGRTTRGQSSMGEFRALSEDIPLEALPVFAVPAHQVEPVKQLFQKFGHKVSVVPLEDIIPQQLAA